jgi:hypothetical protein
MNTATNNSNYSQGIIVFSTASCLAKANAWASQVGDSCDAIFTVGLTTYLDVTGTTNSADANIPTESVWTLCPNFDKPGVVEQFERRGKITRFSNLLIINTTTSLQDEAAVTSFLKQSITATEDYYVEIFC